MIKKLLKIFIIFSLLNLLVGFGVFGWLTYSLLVPSFEGTGIGLTDLLKKDLDPEKYKKLDYNVSIQAEKLSEKSSKKVIDILERLFPSQKFDYSKMPEVKYPYPSTDEVLKLNEISAQKGIEQGLNNLKVQEQMAKEGLKQGLKYLEESEIKNQKIKNATVSNGL